MSTPVKVRAFWAATFTQVRRHRNGLRFTDLRVPQRCAFALTELAAAAPTTQIPQPIHAIHLAYDQIVLARLPVQCAFGRNTC